MTDVLTLQDLTLRHRLTGRTVLHPVSLRIRPFRTLGIVGQSGSGKTLLAKAILGLVPETFQQSGQVCLDDQDLNAISKAQRQQIRGRQIALVVQHGMGAFDPLVPLGQQFLETLRVHQALPPSEGTARVLQCFEQVGLAPAEPFYPRYPHQLSGGQLQRMMIAMALMLGPRLLIADEPTTALDAVTQAGILRELRAIVQQRLSTLIFITHDIGLVREVADDVAVMHQGRLVEHQPTEALWANPQHPYTRFLLATREQLASRFASVMRGPHAVGG